MDSSAANLEALLSQATWVRQLAAHLVRDPEQAEDLVQETWRRALENPPTEAIPDHGLRAWFARVMRNLVADRQKESALRSWHERHASRSEQWSHAELHDRVVLQRELAEAVLSLEQPYQSAITLRYLEGLAPREIARRQNVSYDAVRTRISRGLAMLRARLDKDHGGDRDAWCAVFAGLLGKGTDPHAAPAPGGGISILGVEAKLVAGIVIAWAAALLLVWQVIGAGASKHAVWSPDVTRLHADRLVPDGGAPRATPSDRTPLGRQEPPAARVIDREHDLHGSVIDAAGLPVVGAKIEIFPDESTKYWDVPGATPDRRTVAETTSDAQGEFSVALSVGRPFELDVSAENRATTKLAYRYAGEHVTVQLDAPSVLQGRVTFAANGEPVAGARVQLRTFASEIHNLWLWLREGETDADGRYRFERLPGTNVSLRITPRGAGAVVTRALDLESGATRDEDVLIESGSQIRGRVLDAETGSPIPDAEVGEVQWVQRFGRTNASGEYAYSGIRPGKPTALQARAPGYGQQTFVFRSAGDVDDVPESKDFSLSRGRVLRGRVIDSKGNGIEGVRVAAVANRRVDPPPTGTDWIGGRTDDRGRFELSGLRRDLSHTLFARMDGFGAVAFELPALESKQEVVDLLDDIVLPPMSVLRGTVVDESGRAVQGWEVTVRGSNADRWRLVDHEDPRDHDVDPLVAERTARTDDLGRFSVADLATGEYAVEVGLPGTTARTSKSVSVRAGANVEGVELVLPGLESISGTVADSEGRALADVSVDATGATADSTQRSYTLTDASGHFSLDGLPRGAYSIRVRPPQAHAKVEQPGARAFLTQVLGDIPSGSTGLSIVLETGARIHGRVFAADGRGADNSRVVVRVPGRDDVLGAIAEAGGKFVLIVPVGVSFDLEAYPASLGCVRLPSHPDVASLGGARLSSLVPSDQEVIIRLPQ